MTAPFTGRAALRCICAAAAAALLTLAPAAPAAADAKASTRGKTSAAPLKIKNTRSVYVCSPAGFGQKSRCYLKS